MNFYIATKDALYEEEIKKSKFLSYLYRCDSPEEMKEYLVALKKEHYKSRHICYAAYFGDAMNPVCRSNDDGEPSGTAGKPILEAIIEKRAHNLMIAVVRYFGGIKLGAGGLIRAYHGGAIGALNSAGLIEDVTFFEESIACEYCQYENVKRSCSDQDIEIIGEQFEDIVKLTIRYKEGVVPTFEYGLLLN